jgi:hypothetical protein
MVRSALWHDNRKEGSHGRALRLDIPALHLLKGDRLEPCFALQDVAKFDGLVAPVDVSFWRLSKETQTKHRNPLMDQALGTSQQTLLSDPLHTLNLGVLQAFCTFVVWGLIHCNAWKVTGVSSQEELIQWSVMRLRGGYEWWLGQRAKANPFEKLTAIEDMKVSMFGTATQPLCHAKGAETKSLLLHLVYLLHSDLGAALPNRSELLQAGEALIRHLAIMSENKRVLPPEAQQETIIPKCMYIYIYIYITQASEYTKLY